ncbi:MAG: decarboxylating NADP(+)-dependent phosphogluconate dehydrogenase [Thiotrichaceae bacterium]|nr:decarboxylating NADP(+)-dependent phosphogluconate dehydrogenase [Thiotrichaceae bacterium]
MPQADMGLIGLGVMGQNLALNFSDHHFSLAVYNREKEYTEDFMLGEAKGRAITPCYSHKELVSQLAKPRKIMLMITAGDPVDSTIEALLPLLDKGDIIIDGGNSHFPDTIRRTKSLKEKGILFVGSGISGGEEGARFGPAIMPGGNPEAWSEVQNILQSIAAKVEGEPCCQWIGDGGAGHYVKMVHNGIEYGDMQLIAEAYQFMHEGLGLDHTQMQQVFKEWNEGVLSSYLIEITADILGKKESSGEPLLEKILDAAGQKGTGTWTAMSALEQGVPLTLIGEAVFARCLSSIKASRVKASHIYPHEKRPAFTGDMQATLDALRDALYAAKIISYAQGFMLMQQASDKYHWNLNYGNIALTWRGGCIIRSRFLDNIKAAYEKDPQLENLLLDAFFIDAIKSSLVGWRQTVQTTIGMAIPAPAFSSALSFFDGYRSARTSANMLQAQRDYFGAHTYERVDQPRGKFFHTDWTEGQ